MFPYVDPGGTLQPAAALENYRVALDAEYAISSRLEDSAFAAVEAFVGVPAASIQVSTVSWPAFPRKATVSNAQIDQNRFVSQDEYVEWRVERDGGRVRRITFTTEFLAYYQALARAGTNALVAAIQAVIPGGNPTPRELYGPAVSANPGSLERAGRFVNFAQRNPWINGTKGILCLGHQNNSLLALFRLVDIASIPNDSVEPADLCEALDGFCDPKRNSDPNIAAAVQQLARDGRSFSLKDPAGIEIGALVGIWRRGGDEVDMNDPNTNAGLWKVTRGRRRAVLEVPPDLLLDDQPITTGAQVAAALRVQASVISARNQDLPEWARAGNEGLPRGGGQ